MYSQSRCHLSNGRCWIYATLLNHSECIATSTSIQSVRQWWLPQGTCVHVAVKYKSICFLQVVSFSHHCPIASRGTNLMISVELLSAVPCAMDIASDYLTMFQYLIMPFVFASAAICCWSFVFIGSEITITQGRPNYLVIRSWFPVQLCYHSTRSNIKIIVPRCVK